MAKAKRVVGKLIVRIGIEDTGADLSNGHYCWLERTVSEVATLLETKIREVIGPPKIPMSQETKDWVVKIAEWEATRKDKIDE